MACSTTMAKVTATQIEIPYQMYEIQPRLFLSKFPRELPANITHVLKMCTESHPADSTRTYMQVPIYDFDNITPYIQQIINFLSAAFAKEDRVVLVLCAMGMNRSVAAILTYICHQQGITSSQALDMVKGIKGDVNPSSVFLRQIDLFFGRSSQDEDPLSAFHRRLQARIDAARLKE